MSLKINFYRTQCKSQSQESHLQDIVWKITVLSGNWAEHEKENTSTDRKKNFTKLCRSVNSLLSSQSRKIVRWTPNQEPDNDCDCVSQNNDRKFNSTSPLVTSPQSDVFSLPDWLNGTIFLIYDSPVMGDSFFLCVPTCVFATTVSQLFIEFKKTWNKCESECSLLPGGFKTNWT